MSFDARSLRWTVLCTALILAVYSPSANARKASSKAAQPQTTQSPLPVVGLDIDRVEEKTIHFKGADSPKLLKTNIFELKYLGAIRGEDIPYFFFSGRPCTDCQQTSQIYVFRPDGNTKPTSFVYPGKILETKTRALLHESRAFLGRCLPDAKDVYVVYQRDRVDRRNRLQSSVFVASAGKDYLSERLIEKGLPRLQDTLKRVKSKACREVEGRNRLMLSRPLDMGPRFGVTEEIDPASETESEEDDQYRQNQTDQELKSE